MSTTTTDSMIERVARAISAVASRQKGYDLINPDMRALAISAIAAMREPTDAMCFAGADSQSSEMATPSATLCGIVWYAMIDAALGEQP